MTEHSYTTPYPWKSLLKSGIPLEWIKDAGHNSNTDKPEIVNNLMQSFVKTIQED